MGFPSFFNYGENGLASPRTMGIFKVLIVKKSNFQQYLSLLFALSIEEGQKFGKGTPA
jgi:hypothetical protein